MDTSKISPGQMIAGIGGIVLIISLFLDWISGVSVTTAIGTFSGGGGNAWDVFSIMDIILLLIGAAAIALAALEATETAVNLPVDPALLLALVGVAAFGFTLGWDLENDNAGVGAWLALVACIAIVYGGSASLRGGLAAARPAAASRPSPGGPPSGTAGGPPSSPPPSRP